MLDNLFADYETVESVLVYLIVAAGLLLVTVAALRVSQGDERRESRDESQSVDSRSPFCAFQLVLTLGELNFSHGSGLMVPAGASLQLISRHITTAGPRWSAKWISDDPDSHGIYVYPIPEDMLRMFPMRSTARSHS